METYNAIKQQKQSQTNDNNNSMPLHQQRRQQRIKHNESVKKWKNIFDPKLQNKITNTNTKPCKSERGIAAFQRIKGTNIVINNFNYDSVQNINASNKFVHFLTHFRFDYYIGIESAWQIPIYCSQITANLCQKMLNLNPNILRPLALNEKFLIPHSNPSTFVTLIDANNYIKGSVNLLFQITTNRTVQRRDSNLEKIVRVNGEKNMSIHNWLVADEAKEQSPNDDGDSYEIVYNDLYFADFYAAKSDKMRYEKLKNLKIRRLYLGNLRNVFAVMYLF